MTKCVGGNNTLWAKIVRAQKEKSPSRFSSETEIRKRSTTLLSSLCCTPVIAHMFFRLFQSCSVIKENKYYWSCVSSVFVIKCLTGYHFSFLINPFAGKSGYRNSQMHPHDWHWYHFVAYHLSSFCSKVEYPVWYGLLTGISIKTPFATWLWQNDFISSNSLRELISVSNRSIQSHFNWTNLHRPPECKLDFLHQAIDQHHH